MDKSQLFGVLRAVLAAGGGYLVAKGYLDNGTLNDAISALLVIGTAVWSVIEKQKAK